MQSGYYSDELSGGGVRDAELIDSRLWAGLFALFTRGIASALFAQDFPAVCSDGAGVFGCDAESLYDTLSAEIPALGRPTRDGLPPTPAALDFVQFMFWHASAPSEGTYHRYFDHHHLNFDRDEGGSSIRDAVNRLFARNGSAFELGKDGRVVRLAPAGVATQLRRELPSTTDQTFDALIQTAIIKYRDKEPRVRREALEQLWDAFERCKTMHDPDKKRGAAQLLERASVDASPQERALLEIEMLELTKVGNSFRIRHHEMRAVEPSSVLVDYLFARMYALLVRLHPALP